MRPRGKSPKCCQATIARHSYPCNQKPQRPKTTTGSINTSRIQPAERGHDKLIKTEVCCDVFCYSEFKVPREFDKSTDPVLTVCFSFLFQKTPGMMLSIHITRRFRLHFSEPNTSPALQSWTYVSQNTLKSKPARKNKLMLSTHTDIITDLSVWIIKVILPFFGNKIMPCGC